MTIKEFELQHAFCILVKALSSWSVDDYEQARIIAHSVHSEHVEQDYMQRVFEEADKRRPLLIEGVVNSERTPSELRKYTPCGLPVRQSTAELVATAPAKTLSMKAALDRCSARELWLVYFFMKGLGLIE